MTIYVVFGVESEVEVESSNPFEGPYSRRSSRLYRGVLKARRHARILTRFWPDFGQILVRFLARFLTRGLARCFGVENTVYSSTGTEKYSFTGSEEKGEKNLVCLNHSLFHPSCSNFPVFGHNSLPRRLIGTRIGGNASYQPPGPP